MTLEYQSPDLSAKPLKPAFSIIALLLGLILVLLAGTDMYPLRWLVVLSALGLSIVPFVNTGLATILDKIRNPTPQGRRLVAIGAGAMAALYLWVTATIQNRSFVPRMQDECSYIISKPRNSIGRCDITITEKVRKGESAMIQNTARTPATPSISSAITR